MRRPTRLEEMNTAADAYMKPVLERSEYESALAARYSGYVRRAMVGQHGLRARRGVAFLNWLSEKRPDVARKVRRVGGKSAGW
jgi:hypothetical protein